MSSRPPISAQTSLIPVNDCVLVQLEKTSIKEGKYDTRTNGIAIAFSTTRQREPITLSKDELKKLDNAVPLKDGVIVHDLTNKRVYFEEYKEGARIKKDGELYCFIKIEDIRGYEDV